MIDSLEEAQATERLIQGLKSLTRTALLVHEIGYLPITLASGLGEDDATSIKD